ncbi:MAG: flagellar biosynthesis protein FlhB [Lachnospiraceae bacterium]|nr:flagellar biosynthesis protein FlhB [Lachnospiraceae bacterium]
MLSYNLQFFAKDGPGGEKTEPATQKKLSDARKEGQVAKSKEIAHAFGLLTLFLVLKFWVGNMGKSFLEIFSMVYNKVPEMIIMAEGEINNRSMVALLRNSLLELMIMVLPIFMIGFVVAFVTDLVQVKWRPTTKPLKPKFKKMNPVSGFKRFFSKNSLVELIKSIAKIGVITYVVYSYLKDQAPTLFMLYEMPFMQAIELLGSVATNLGIRISIVYMVIAFCDYAYQKHKFKEDMKMTKQEVKDEYKNSEGNPEIKSKIRSKMREVSQRRMMQNLPKADVVITNPTHYAVAIKYDPDVADAPIVLAKGEDYLAQKIKEVAREHHIEIVENKPLARMLYSTVDIGMQVPPELYQAVAEVLAMVYSLQGKV